MVGYAFDAYTRRTIHDKRTKSHFFRPHTMIPRHLLPSSTLNIKPERPKLQIVALFLEDGVVVEILHL